MAIVTANTMCYKRKRLSDDVPTVLLDGKNTQSDRREVNRTVLSGCGARMGSPRPSYKELRSRKVAIGSNSLEVESRKVDSRKVAKSQSRKVAKSKVDRKHRDLEVY